MMNWDYIIASTPNTLRAFIMVVLLGLIAMSVTVLSLAVWKGQGFQAWGLKVDEFRLPDAQKCASLVEAVPLTNRTNDEVFAQLSTQITQTLALIDKHKVEENRIRAGTSFFSVADSHRDEAEKHRKDLEALRAKQSEIIKSRADVAAAVVASCSKSNP
jgi:hypothetical protein